LENAVGGRSVAEILIECRPRWRLGSIEPQGAHDPVLYRPTHLTGWRPFGCTVVKVAVANQIGVHRGGVVHCLKQPAVRPRGCLLRGIAAEADVVFTVDVACIRYRT